MPELVALFDPDEFNLGELLKQCYKRRSRGRRASALLPESVIEEYYEGIRTM